MTPTILVVALVVAAAICFDVYCLVDLRRSRVRHLSKWGWALVIFVSNPWGGLAYLIFGRDGTGPAAPAPPLPPPPGAPGGGT
ncbi:MAG: PLD nuclease N-terminal domain-containing protein, partial [Trebonia sp.]|uniref:PLD nuclease N-terminal domain-containing protein n=4 Tax=Trebonia sp. TaxID=2767075 RepID=UPI003BB0D28F